MRHWGAVLHVQTHYISIYSLFVTRQIAAAPLQKGAAKQSTDGDGGA